MRRVSAIPLVLGAILLGMGMIASAAPAREPQHVSPPTDYSGLGLNTKQLAAVRANEGKADARDRASFEKLWVEAPTEMKKGGPPKSVWFALYKWSITIGTVGECSRFLDHEEVDRLRHAWDETKGMCPYLDALIEAGDEAYQDGDAKGNDPGAPDEQTCAVNRMPSPRR